MIRFTCKKCGQKFKLADALAGKKGKCHKCGNVIVIPQQGAIGSTPEQQISNETEILKLVSSSIRPPKNGPTLERQDDFWDGVGPTDSKVSFDSATGKDCPYCGEKILEKAIKCKHCGEFLDGNSHRDRTTIRETPTTPNYPRQEVQYLGTSGMAIASFISALIGLFVLGIIFGHVALKNIDKSNGGIGGTGFAIIGLILSYLQAAFWLLFILFTIGALGSAIDSV